jgi:hypothetical protein
MSPVHPDVAQTLLLDSLNAGVKAHATALSGMRDTRLPTSFPCGVDGAVAHVHHNALFTLLEGQGVLLAIEKAKLTGEFEDAKTPATAPTGNWAFAKWSRANGLELGNWAAMIAITFIVVVTSILGTKYLMTKSFEKRVDAYISSRLQYAPAP